MTFVVLHTAIALAVAILVFATRRPSYDHRRDTISELGERSAPDSRIVSLGVFLPVGLVLAFVWSTERAASSATAALAGAIAIGYVGAALFPCDPGSPLQGSWRQSMHNLAGGVEYVGGAFALMDLGAMTGAPFGALGGVVIVTTLSSSFPSFARWRGLLQRVAEIALFGGLIIALSQRAS